MQELIKRKRMYENLQRETGLSDRDLKQAVRHEAAKYFIEDTVKASTGDEKALVKKVEGSLAVDSRRGFRELAEALGQTDKQLAARVDRYVSEEMSDEDFDEMAVALRRSGVQMEESEKRLLKKTSLTAGDAARVADMRLAPSGARTVKEAARRAVTKDKKVRKRVMEELVPMFTPFVLKAGDILTRPIAESTDLATALRGMTVENLHREVTARMTYVVQGYENFHNMHLSLKQLDMMDVNRKARIFQYGENSVPLALTRQVFGLPIQGVAGGFDISTLLQLCVGPGESQLAALKKNARALRIEDSTVTAFLKLPLGQRIPSGEFKLLIETSVWSKEKPENVHMERAAFETFAFGKLFQRQRDERVEKDFSILTILLLSMLSQGQPFLGTYHPRSLLRFYEQAFPMVEDRLRGGKGNQQAMREAMYMLYIGLTLRVPPLLVSYLLKRQVISKKLRDSMAAVLASPETEWLDFAVEQANDLLENWSSEGSKFVQDESEERLNEQFFDSVNFFLSADASRASKFYGKLTEAGITVAGEGSAVVNDKTTWRKFIKNNHPDKLAALDEEDKAYRALQYEKVREILDDFGLEMSMNLFAE